MNDMLKRRMINPRFLRGLTGCAAVVVLWQLSVPLVGLEPYFYPAPVDVVHAFAELMQKGILPAYVSDSLYRFIIGAVIGCSLGIFFGLLIGLSRVASQLLTPLISFLFAIVEMAWIPIFVLWWGYGLLTITVALSYVVFFPVLYNTLLGVRAVPSYLINATRSLGGSQFNVVFQTIIPAVTPNIITGVRMGAGFAFRGLIFAEIVAAKTGLGYLIFESASSQQTARTIVGMIVVGLLWLAIEKFFIKPFEQATVERWGLVTQEGGQQ